MRCNATVGRHAISLGVLAGVLLAGCESPRTASTEAADCSSELQGQVSLSASAVPQVIPADLAVDEGQVKSYGLVDRRVLISISPSESARGIRILSSTLAITTLGGTFPGWAALASNGLLGFGHKNLADDRSIEVTPGRLRVTPFLRTATLHAQTIALDVLITPGGVPIDEMTLTTSPLWSDDRHPVAPEALTVTLIPMRHFTVYDTVIGLIQLEYIAVRSRSTHVRETCSAEGRFELVGRDAVRPPLWDLGTSIRGGSRQSWLALYDPVTGPVRAIFTSPAAAIGFLTWLRQTGATQAGSYQLGVFQPADSNDTEPLVRFERFRADSFHPLTADELSTLTVGPLGEP